MRALPEAPVLLQRCKERIPRQTRLAFCSAMIAGLLAHLYTLLNKLPNHDDILGLFLENDSTISGRWFLAVPSALSSCFSLPWITGLLALLWLACAAACVTALLQIKRSSMIVLTSAILATFPTVYYTFCYQFTADAYLFALLLAALGALLTDRYRWGFVAGGVCLGLSLATYQAYIFFSIGLFGVRMLCLLLFEYDAAPKSLCVKLLHYLLALVLGAAIYRVGLTVSLSLRGATLKTYMGLDGVSALSVSDAIKRIPLALQSDLEFFSGRSELLPGKRNALLFTASCAAIVLQSAAAMARLVSRRHAARIPFAAAILCALPLILNGITLVSVMGAHPLMLYPISLVYVLPVALYDRLSRIQDACAQDACRERFRPARILLGYGIAACLALCAFTWSVDANQTYLVLQLKFDNMMSLVTRMVDRVEQLPEYEPNVTPVWYTGTLSDGNYGVVKNAAFARSSATDLTGQAWNYTTIMNNLYFSAFVNNYIGVTFVDPGEDAANAAMATDAYRAMPYFPEPGSVQCIDGIILINGGPNPQSPP